MKLVKLLLGALCVSGLLLMFLPRLAFASAQMPLTISPNGPEQRRSGLSWSAF